MTISTKHPRRMALPTAALAALLLAGCSSDNVGESWQCPLAAAGTCDSVSAADPAVPDMSKPRSAVLREPLWRVRAAEPDTPAPCSACNGGFDPFAWLARLFGVETAEEQKSAVPEPTRHLPPESPMPAALPAEPALTPLPVEPDAAELHTITEDSEADDLRTDEVVARIWIAPFVDADGVYREASWVRAVLEPAGWRLGR